MFSRTTTPRDQEQVDTPDAGRRSYHLTTASTALLLTLGLVAAATPASPTPALREAVTRQRVTQTPATPFPGNPHNALQVISITTPNPHRTRATLTLWQRLNLTSPWRQIHAPIRVSVGRYGLTSRPREGKAATPIGSFRLTHAYGKASLAARPTSLAYHQLQPGDGWTSTDGPGYNTLNHYSNEMYRGRDTWMRDAILIDYNTSHPRPGAGSGFFLHVGGNAPTDGCISMPLGDLLAIMDWITPNSRPRLITAVER